MSVQNPEDLLGWQVRFHSLVEWKNLNGQFAYVVRLGQHPGHVFVFVSSLQASKLGCPQHFECAFSNLIPITRGSPF